jgi:multisubunit Na+/H+ antiporter MnhF subunit
MNPFILAAIVLVAATVPLGWLAVRGTAGDGIVAVELAGMIISLAMLALAKGIERQPFASLAVVLAVCSFAGSLAFVRFLELGGRDR